MMAAVVAKSQWRLCDSRPKTRGSAMTWRSYACTATGFWQKPQNAAGLRDEPMFVDQFCGRAIEGSRRNVSACLSHSVCSRQLPKSRVYL